MTSPDWDDDRLDAAFHARYDRSAPTTAAHDVHVRIAGTSPARLALPRIGQPWSLAAAAVVAVLVGAAMLVPAAISLPGASAGPSVLPSVAATGAPGASAMPTDQAIPGSVFGLPIVHVPDAIAIRDGAVDDREIAVQGWFVDSATPACPAPATPPVGPMEVGCPDRHVWLMDRAESLIHVSGNQTSVSSPIGPALNPDLQGLDRSWEPASGADAIDVVLVGHFDDRRAGRCGGTGQACRDRFVVDSVAMVHSAPTNVGPVYQNTTKATSSAADIEAIVGNEAPGSLILSMTVVDGPDGLAHFEPSLSDVRHNYLALQPTVWIVRVLESERISTYIVVDGSDAIFEMNQIGEAVLVGGAPPTPGANPH